MKVIVGIVILAAITGCAAPPQVKTIEGTQCIAQCYRTAIQSPLNLRNCLQNCAMLDEIVSNKIN